jgi:hypothetical protein
LLSVQVSTPQNVGRRLRELENEGVVEVKYVKGHAHYRFSSEQGVELQTAPQMEWFESLPHSATVGPLERQTTFTKSEDTRHHRTVAAAESANY